jgi:hypothetical protein
MLLSVSYNQLSRNGGLGGVTKADRRFYPLDIFTVLLLFMEIPAILTLNKAKLLYLAKRGIRIHLQQAIQNGS